MNYILGIIGVVLFFAFFGVFAKVLKYIVEFICHFAFSGCVSAFIIFLLLAMLVSVFL